MDEAYKFHLKKACLNRGWTYEDCDIGVIINDVKIETLKELDDFVQANS